jgi:hypothetical protein
VGGVSANSLPEVLAAPPPTPDPSPPRASRVGGGEKEASRFATSSLVPFVDARARWAAASPPARRSQELSGGGFRPVPEPRPASPRLIAGLSSFANACPIGCTSGRDALPRLFFAAVFRDPVLSDLAIAAQYGWSRTAMEGFAGAAIHRRCKGELADQNILCLY